MRSTRASTWTRSTTSPRRSPRRSPSGGSGVVAITHQRRLLEVLRPTAVHVFAHGRIVESGGTELVDRLERDGLYEFLMIARGARARCARVPLVALRAHGTSSRGERPSIEAARTERALLEAAGSPDRRERGRGRRRGANAGWRRDPQRGRAALPRPRDRHQGAAATHGAAPPAPQDASGHRLHLARARAPARRARRRQLLLRLPAVQDGAERPLCGTVHKVCDPEVPGKPFNVLAIGSDSRAGLTGRLAEVTGAGSVGGQRSDVVKIFHVDPAAGTISVLSIPRDTVVTLLANQVLFGNYNRINVNYQNGPTLLVQTIEANFGIPINHVIQVGLRRPRERRRRARRDLHGLPVPRPRPLLLARHPPHRVPAAQRLRGARRREEPALLLPRRRPVALRRHERLRPDRPPEPVPPRPDRAREVRGDQPRRRSRRSSTAIPQGIADRRHVRLQRAARASRSSSTASTPHTMAAYTLPVVPATARPSATCCSSTSRPPSRCSSSIFGQVGTAGGLTRAHGPAAELDARRCSTPPPAVATPRPPPPATPGRHVTATTPAAAHRALVHVQPGRVHAGREGRPEVASRPGPSGVELDERLVERVPRERRALDAHRELDHALQRRELAERAARRRAPRRSSSPSSATVIMRLKVRIAWRASSTRLALHRAGHERGRGLGDRAAVARDLEVADASRRRRRR